MMTQTVTTPEEVYEAVEQGARWLDEHCPDWLDKIDLATLDLVDSGKCILGQTAKCLVPEDVELDGGHADGERPGPCYYEVEMQYEEIERHPEDYGFNVVWSDRERISYEMLTIAWKELIEKRRGGA